jgi:hypothetical protein
VNLVGGACGEPRIFRRQAGGSVSGQGMVVAAMDLPRERSNIDAWARDFGQARGLGEYRNSCSAAHRSTRTGWGIFLIGLGLLPGLAFASAAPAQLRPAIAGVAVALIALGAALIKTAPREKVDWIFQYAGGIAQVIDGEAVPRVVPWGLLGHVLKEYSDDPDETCPSPLAVHVFAVDGTVITAGRKYGAGQLERYVDEVVVAMRLPAAIEQYQSGAPVLFGDLSVSQDEIAWAGGAKRAAWRDIRSVRMQPYQIDINASAWKPGHKIWLNGVPDSCVAVLLIQEAAARAGIRQNGSPVAVPPPDAAPAVLSATDVSEVLGRPVEVTGVGAGGLAVAVFKGGGITLSVGVMNRGAFNAINGAAGRRFGRALPGIGEEAWLLNKDRTVIVRAGLTTVKLTLTGLPPAARAAALIPLARLVAARLAAPPSE